MPLYTTAATMAMATREVIDTGILGNQVGRFRSTILCSVLPVCDKYEVGKGRRNYLYMSTLSEVRKFRSLIG
jgi:hypothetical protein